MSYTGYDYPTEEQLEAVTKWQTEWTNNGTTPHYESWFELVKALWWLPDWGWNEFDGYEDDEPVRVLHISTGGWSGNEDLISAMAGNFIAWGQTFYIHKRGGHYEFRYPDHTRSRRNEAQRSSHIG